MTKKEFIDEVQGKAHAAGAEITKVDAKAVVDAVFDVISQEMSKGDGTSLPVPGFGTFKCKLQKARQGRNPQTGAPLTIAARNAVSFKPAPALKERVN